MPAKSRHTKSKHIHDSKKSKARQRQEAAGVPAVTPATPAHVAEPVSITPPPHPVATTPHRQPATDYPYVTGELRRIGVLAALICAILVILAVTVP
jgi:hypothetical protein